MQRSFWVCFFIASCGIFLVVLPDRDRPLFQFNESHGPSLIDTIGLVLLTGSWIWLMRGAIVLHKKIILDLGRRKTLFLFFLMVVGTILIINGLLLNTDFLLWTGVSLSTIANAGMIIPAFRVRG